MLRTACTLFCLQNMGHGRQLSIRTCFPNVCVFASACSDVPIGVFAADSAVFLCLKDGSSCFGVFSRQHKGKRRRPRRLRDSVMLYCVLTFCSLRRLVVHQKCFRLVV